MLLKVASLLLYLWLAPGNFATGSSASDTLSSPVFGWSYLTDVPCCPHLLAGLSRWIPDLPYHHAHNQHCQGMCPSHHSCPAPHFSSEEWHCPSCTESTLGCCLTTPQWASSILLLPKDRTSGNKNQFQRCLFFQKHLLTNATLGIPLKIQISLLYCTLFKDPPIFSCVFQKKHTIPYYDFFKILLVEWQLQDQEVWFLCLRIGSEAYF